MNALNKFKRRPTPRGFQRVEFEDHYGAKCDLQESSGSSAPGLLWIGVTDPNPKIMASEAAAYGVKTNETTGWVPYPKIPPAVMITTRMHLHKAQIEELIVLLQRWVEKGEL